MCRTIGANNCTNERERERERERESSRGRLENEGRMLQDRWQVDRFLSQQSGSLLPCFFILFPCS